MTCQAAAGYNSAGRPGLAELLRAVIALLVQADWKIAN